MRLTPKQQKERDRLLAALQEHGAIAYEATPTDAEGKNKMGLFLYQFLDAAYGKAKPSAVDAGRKNAIRWLRREAKRAKGIPAE